MATELKFLSHASCFIRTENEMLLFDPWLIGSCYWKSWWNYPPVNRNEILNLSPSAIYITHVHWDHWHGPTLKKLFDKNTLIITHSEPNGRSVRDLKAIGFKNIKLLKHGEEFSLGDIKLTPYQFGLFLNDSAVVVEAPGLKLLNANDCKIAGASLRELLNRHGRFDFALRSHSSANDRICYQIEGDDSFQNDDPLHYARAFKLFMDAVKPKYAVPFASNHVHLHKDVYHLNNIINDPYKLREQLVQMGGISSEIKILLSGDSWSTERGFTIDQKNQIYFLNKEIEISKYKDQVMAKLEKFYELEDRVRITDSIINKFQGQINSIPSVLRNRFKNWTYCMELFSASDSELFEVSPKYGTIKKIDIQRASNFNSLIKIPKKIFKDAVALNMFHHSSISKRNVYRFKTVEDFNRYSYFQKLLELVELEVFPIRILYIFKLFQAYIRRWREVFIYFKAILLTRKGMPIYEIEEQILSKT